MLRSTVLALFALVICSDALAITLVPVPLTSTSQTISAGNVTASDPTDAVADWSDSSGMGKSEAKVAGGILQLSNQGTLTSFNDVNGFHDLQFTIPDFGSGTTAIVFTITQVSSELSGVRGGGETVGNNPGIYRSAILGNAQVTLPSPLQLSSGATATIISSTAATENFLAGDTVQVELSSQTSYVIAQGSSSGSFSESFTVQAFAVEPTPEPSTSVLVGMGLLALSFCSRRTASATDRGR